MPAIAERQLNINLPENMLDELEKIAKESNLSMAEVVQTALALVKIASDANHNKQRLVVADQNGRAIKQINLPK
jgi:metal-responsive CopG/Arc/MetJ family transcriptional regulator